MLEGKTIAVVVPAYNEEKQIGMVIESMPDFVDRIVIVNDKSTDATAEVVRGYIERDTKQKFLIENILEKVKPSKYNHASVVVQKLQKEEIKYIFINKIEIM